MCPSVALAVNVFRTFAGVVLGLLVVGGLVVATLRRGLRRDVRHAWRWGHRAARTGCGIAERAVSYGCGIWEERSR